MKLHRAALGFTIMAVGAFCMAPFCEAESPQPKKRPGVVQVGDEAPNFMHELVSAQGKSRPPKFLGNLVRTVPCRDAGDGTAV
jgi:hypothetical protein